MLADSQRRNQDVLDLSSTDSFSSTYETERGDGESYVPDGRSLLRPAQVVEGRVFEMLQRAPVLVSQFERPARPRFR